METLKGIFKDLLKELQKEAYSNNTAILLGKLEDKIDEVYNRIACVINTVDEIKEAIEKYTERVDKNEDFTMSVSDHDSILRGSKDILIAMDLTDEGVVAENWYGLFYPVTIHEEEAIEEVAEDKLYFRITNSKFNNNGKYCEVLDVKTDNIGNFNCLLEVEDNVRMWFNIEDGYFVDINNKVIEIKIVDEQVIRIFEETPEVESNSIEAFDKQKIVNEIIDKLNQLEVDGETLEYIIDQVGMKDQILRQLVMNSPKSKIDDLVEEKIYDTRIKEDF